MVGHEIEIFTAGCPLCKKTVEIVREAMCPECILKEYKIAEREEDMRRAEEKGVKSIPTMIIDERIRIEGVPTLELVKRVLGT